MTSPWTESDEAKNLLAMFQCGHLKTLKGHFREYETVYGPAEGFVYFVTIGRPYVSHVKIGYTTSNPYARMSSLQTGCPFPLDMLGFVLGTQSMERELHDVLRDDRRVGEWFVYSDYAQKIISDQLNAEILSGETGDTIR